MPEREAKLSKKRHGKAAKAARLEALKTVELVADWVALKGLRTDELITQMKVWKHIVCDPAAKRTTGSRTELVRALQPLILARFGPQANNLRAGDDGLYCEALRRRGERASGGKRRRMVRWGQWEWDANAEFIIERIMDRMVADGGEVPGRTGVKAGTVLYKVLWDGWPEEIATWEDEDNIPLGEVDFIAEFEARLERSEHNSDESSSSDSGSDDDDV